MSFRSSASGCGCVRADIGSRSCRALFFEGEMADLFANPDVWHPIRSGFVGAAWRHRFIGRRSTRGAPAQSSADATRVDADSTPFPMLVFSRTRDWAVSGLVRASATGLAAAAKAGRILDV